MYRSLFALLVGCLPLSAAAYSVADFDTARTLEPQHIEIHSGFAAGDDHWTVNVGGRAGLKPNLDVNLRAGFLLMDGNAGFEVEFGARRRLLDTTDTAGIVDVALALDISFAKANPSFLIGFDPKLLISRHFSYTKKRKIFFGVSVGGALTLIDVAGTEDGQQAGFSAAITAGLDLTDKFRFAFEVAFRDDLKRIGGSLSHTF